MVSGNTQSYTVERNIFLLKFASDGTLLRSEWIQQDNSGHTKEILATADGGFISGGSSHSLLTGTNDIQVIKFDSNGDIEWDALYGGSANEFGNCIAESNDGGFILGSQTRSYGAQTTANLSLIKITSTG